MRWALSQSPPAVQVEEVTFSMMASVGFRECLPSQKHLSSTIFLCPPNLMPEILPLTLEHFEARGHSD